MATLVATSQGEGGKTDEVNKRQLAAVIPKIKDAPCVPKHGCGPVQLVDSE